jgi:DNA sulfur modification protein DndB
LYDHRDDWAKLARIFVLRCPTFSGVVELERSTLSLRSSKLFTLSAIYHATASLMTGHTHGSLEQDAQLAQVFWEEVGRQLPEWTLVRERKMPAGEVRLNYIHSHGVALHAIGKAGNALLNDGERIWKNRLKRLTEINWSRRNASLWEGRAMIAGRISKSAHNVILTTNVIKNFLGLPLNQEEQRAENAYSKGVMAA